MRKHTIKSDRKTDVKAIVIESMILAQGCQTD